MSALDDRRRARKAFPPAAVQLHFRREPEPDPRHARLTVEVCDPENGEPLVWSALDVIARWLRLHGYRYLPGTNAVWVRP